MPFRALVNDILARLKIARIDYLKWRSGETNPTTIIIINANIISGTRFLIYVFKLAKRGYLRRVVINECYLTLTASV
jgi:hypothetical protein